MVNCCRFGCLILLLFASVVQAVTPDQADLASTRGFMLLMALAGDLPDDQELSGSLGTVCQAAEHAAKRSVLAPLGFGPGEFVRTILTPPPVISRSSKLASRGGRAPFPGRGLLESLCRITC